MSTSPTVTRLTRAVMDRMLAGVSTRKFAVVGEPVGEEVEQESSSTSKSTVSEMFIERTKTALGELMGRSAGRRASGGDDARRDGDRRSHPRRRARDHAPRA